MTPTAMKYPSPRLWVSLAASMLAISPAGCQPAGRGENPVAVGKVGWLRDYDTAIVQAKSTGKPLFVLFQEVPGCAGCQQFGRDVLGDAKVVKAIEENFTPLLIHNNAAGKDREVLAKFGEPAWNYQVVRFLGANGKDLIPRKDKVWEGDELLLRMKQALAKAGKVVPADFGMTRATTKRAVIAQYCFWTGEMKIGGIDGVQRTEAGYLNGSEVTLVDYDPAKISLSELSAKAKAAGVASEVFPVVPAGYRKAPDSDQKRHLQGTKYSHLPLTPEQATKINAFARVSPELANSFLREEQRQNLR